MNIQTVKANLKRIIARKEMLLATYENKGVKVYSEEVRSALINQLILNIAEFHDILNDLETCVEIPERLA